MVKPKWLGIIYKNTADEECGNTLLPPNSPIC